MWMLEWIKMLEELSSEELSQLEVFCQKKHLKEWDILFEEWQEANAMYLLVEWEIDIYKKNDFKNINLWTIEPEDILWEMAIFWNSWKRMAWAKAKKDSVMITILSFSIKELTEKHPNIMNKMKELIEKRIYENKLKNL